jgi:hypothetical protein
VYNRVKEIADLHRRHCQNLFELLFEEPLVDILVMQVRSELVIWSTAAVILAAYVGTLSVSIAGGDSGEIVAEGCHLGTAHPPGYPLITTIIYAITRLDMFGTVAHRVNLFCAVCTTLASVLVGKTVLRLHPSKSMAGAVAAMGLFALSPLIWQYAITAEVFPLNTLFAALIVYLVVTFSAVRNNVTIAYIGAFVCGLALCNQHTIVLFEAPLILWMLFLQRNHIKAHPTVLVILSVCFLAGLLPYAYLPIASSIAPKPGSWGQVDTLSGFLHHILRKDYGTFQLFSGEQGKNSEGFGPRNAAFLADFVGTQVGLTDHKEWNAYGTLLLCVITVGIIAACGGAVYSLMVTSNTKQGLTGARRAAAANPTGSPAGKRKDTIKTALSASIAQQPPGSAVNSSAVAATAQLALSPAECAYTPLVLLGTLAFYFAVFHSLSNLPLHDRLLYGVHQRFWMQPNILMFTFLGVGVNALLNTARWGLERLFTSRTDAAGKMGSGNSKPKNTANSTADSSPSTARSATATPVAQKLGYTVLHTAFWVISVLAVIAQFRTWQPVLDMHENTHFADYARAVLAPLPQNAILLINYDQQWTSVRYLQICEGYRSDVTAMQLSMMTYPWFQHKRALYPNITFPGAPVV